MKTWPNLNRAIFGTPGPIRTGGLRIRSPLLYPAELQAHINRTTHTIKLGLCPRLKRQWPDDDPLKPQQPGCMNEGKAIDKKKEPENDAAEKY